ncbi:uncharacterized protein LOC136075356 [Hydra vulgaris]|uniref:Uncharacterized protein LOC136075356 n=1 Tax=Hydra vulgaris TaxID=6087 RepID=A0ABM4B657_HYDVU
MPLRKTSKSLNSVRWQKEDELAIFNSQEKIESINVLYEKLKTNEFNFAIINYLCNDILYIQSSDFLKESAIARFLLCIYKDLTFEAFHCGVKISVMTLSSNRVYIMNKFSHIQEALRFLNCCEITPKKEVVYQQILSMNKTCIGGKKYPIETIVRAFEYFSLSRSAYNRIREDFELPSLRTLGRITSKCKSLDDTTYIRHIFSNLRDDRQKTCILLLDEVYVKPMLQYHGGIVFGKSVNKPHLLANTVLSFLVVTLFNGPKFLYKMLPVRELDAEFLFEQTTLILDAIKNNGGNVVAIVCDGNRVNQKFYNFFEKKEAWCTKDNIFLLFDYVHLLKSIRNNWITEKTQELEFYIDGEKK